MKYSKVKFIKSIAALNELPQDTGIEIAFAGRSNAGKSSALNTITGVNSLAKTSKTPGRTQLINFFALEEEKFLVDLPGYGYAKVPESIKQHWQQILEQYISTRQSLKGIILVMDIRHPLKPIDLQMVKWCTYYQHQIHILLTKADKLTRNIANATLVKTKSNLKNYGDLISIQKFSSLTKEGLEEVHTILDNWFNF